MQTRGSTLQDSPPHPTPPHTMLIPNRPHLQLPQYRTNTALPQNMQPPSTQESVQRNQEDINTHTQAFFLSTMLCLDTQQRQVLRIVSRMPTDDNSDNRKQNTRETTNAKGKNNESSHSGTPSQCLSLSLSPRYPAGIILVHSSHIAVKSEAHWDPISLSLSLKGTQRYPEGIILVHSSHRSKEGSALGPISVSLSQRDRDTRRVSYWYTLVIAVKREAHSLLIF
jgi:hypothetical protein